MSGDVVGGGVVIGAFVVTCFGFRGVGVGFLFDSFVFLDLAVFGSDCFFTVVFFWLFFGIGGTGWACKF